MVVPFHRGHTLPMNRVQFQPGLSLPQFLHIYGTEAACEQAPSHARWPAGFVMCALPERECPSVPAFRSGLLAVPCLPCPDPFAGRYRPRRARPAPKSTAPAQVNVVLGNLKRSLAEAAWRFNRRFNLKALVPRLLATAATCPPWPESALRNVPVCRPC